jgi:hypothetical protein
MSKPYRKPRDKHGRTPKYPRYPKSREDQRYWIAPISPEVRRDKRQLDLLDLLEGDARSTQPE